MPPASQIPRDAGARRSPPGARRPRGATLVIAAASALAIPVACDRSPAGSASTGQALVVAACIAPQAYWTRRIAGPEVKILILVAPGQSPHTYEPTPRQMAALREARAFFRIGLALEDRILAKLGDSHADLQVVDTRKGVELLTLDHEEHDHATGHVHEETYDPHTWLNPANAKIQARAICDTLRRLDPNHAERYDENLAALHAELDVLDARLRAMLAPYRGESFYVFHPAFGYFADAYGLRQVAIEAAGKQPGGRKLTALIADARARGVRVILVEAQSSPRGAEAVAEAIGATTKTVDPLADDYTENLERIGAAVADALSRQKRESKGRLNADHGES